MRELGIYLKLPHVSYCDNISSIALASNPVYHARTRHVEVNCHFIREKVLQGDIEVSFVSSVNQLTYMKIVVNSNRKKKESKIKRCKEKRDISLSLILLKLSLNLIWEGYKFKRKL